MTALRLMTWNVENLFTPDGGTDPDADAFEEKLTSLAAVIDDAAPDVLALQEVGSDAALARLQDKLQHEMGFRMVGDPGWSRHRCRVAVDVGVGQSGRPADVPRGSVADPDRRRSGRTCRTGDTMDQMARGALQATVALGSESLDVVVCHLKSKLLTFPGGRFSPRDEGERARFAAYALYRRTSEATTLRSHLNEVLAGAGRDKAVVLAGDLNDEPDAATTQILLGPPGSEIGTRGFDTPDAGDGDRLWNLAPRIPEAERFSRRYRGRNELIDHIMVSHRLVHHVSEVRTLVATGQLPSIEDDPGRRIGAPGSDHSAVVARFDLA